MLSDKEYSDIFEEACESYGGIRILLNLVNKQETPNVCKMVATFSRQDWVNKDHFRAVAYHEVAHPSYMPEWYEDHIMYISLLRDVFINNNSKDLNDLMYVSNIIYDMMVDRYNQMNFSVNLKLLVDSVLIKISYDSLDKSGILYKLLICYYNHCLGGNTVVETFYEFDPNIKRASLRCVNIVDSKISKKDKVKKLAFVISTLLSSHGETLNDAVNDLKKSSLDFVNGDKPETSNVGNDPLSDALENGDIDEDLFDFLFDKENDDANKIDDDIKASNATNGTNEGDGEDISQWIKEAKNNVSITLKKRSKVTIKGVGKNKDGLMVRSGIWNENNNIQELDMLSTLSSHSFFIPGEYAVKKSIVSDSIKNKSKKYNLHIVMDTSGSVPSKTGSIIIFTLIEAARLNKNNVSVSLFHHDQYYENTIINTLRANRKVPDNLYKGFCVDIANHWKNGRTNLNISFNYLKTIKNKIMQYKSEDNLIVLITDFVDCQDNQNKLIKDINDFSKVSKVLVISIGNRDYILNNKLEKDVEVVYTNDIYDCSLKCLDKIEF